MARRIPRIKPPARYRMEPLPGLPGELPAVSWSPAPAPDPCKQGWLALDGGALGPLFNDHTAADR